MHAAFSDLTGCPAVSHELVGVADNASERDLLWAKLLSYQDSQCPMGASCGTQPNDAATHSEHDIHSDHNNNNLNAVPDLLFTKAGLLQNHAYAILAVFQIDGYQLVKLRNPWGRSEWKGEWSLESPCWTPHLRQLLQPTSQAKDGVFYMSYGDLLVYFRSIDVCLYHPDWHSVRLRSFFPASSLPSTSHSAPIIATTSTNPDTTSTLSFHFNSGDNSTTQIPVPVLPPTPTSTLPTNSASASSSSSSLSMCSSEWLPFASDSMFEIVSPFSSWCWLSIIQQDQRGSIQPEPHIYADVAIYVVKLQPNSNNTEQPSYADFASHASTPTPTHTHTPSITPPTSFTISTSTLITTSASTSLPSPSLPLLHAENEVFSCSSSPSSFGRVGESFPCCHKVQLCEVMITDTSQPHYVLPVSLSPRPRRSASSGSICSCGCFGGVSCSCMSGVSFVLHVYSSMPMLVRPVKPYSLPALRLAIQLSAARGTMQQLNQAATLYTLCARGCLFFVVLNRHQAKYLHLSLDLSDSVGLHSSRQSLVTIDYIPPNHRQLLICLTTKSIYLGYKYKRQATYCHVDHIPPPSSMHHPPLLSTSSDIHYPTII